MGLSSVHSFLTPSSGKKLCRIRWCGCSRDSRSLKLAPIESRIRLLISLYRHCAYLLSFPRCNNLLVENLCFFRRFAHSSLVWSRRKGFCHVTQGIKVGIKKLEPLGAWSSEHLSPNITGFWQTHRQTDAQAGRRTDRLTNGAACNSRSSIHCNWARQLQYCPNNGSLTL